MDPVRATPATDVLTRTAIGASRLRGLPPAVIAEITAEARGVHVAAGTILRSEGATEPHLDLVVTGLVRVRVSASDGRTMTVRYCRPGDLVGVPTLFADPGHRAFAVQALVGSQILRLRPATARGLAARDVRVAGIFLEETSERVLSFVAEISGSTFSTVRQRLARHLLDLASERQQGRDLVAPVTQQELAEAIGTVREVVVRVLRELRAEDVVRTGPHGITVLEPERLFAVAEGQGWNEGS
jgi:CRP/FNR family transcriptional regulator, cyclic AMP receptor protein